MSINGLALQAQAKMVTRPFVYDGPDMREGAKEFLQLYMPNLDVRLVGPAIEGDFGIPEGITVFDACEDLYEQLDVVVAWFTDGVMVKDRHYVSDSVGGLAGFLGRA